ncbi:MAG: methionine--tRNA ligase subunit beta [Candidatus Binatota bacterium]
MRGVLSSAAKILSGKESGKMVSIDEFRRIELKVATIKKAEPHPNADKLLVLQIDLGSEERQIVAGIKGHYAPEELVGRQVVVVANLETAKLRGVESQGMLLAASDGERIVILTPEKEIHPGAKVS